MATVVETQLRRDEFDMYGSRRKLQWIPRDHETDHAPNSILCDPPIQRGSGRLRGYIVPENSLGTSGRLRGYGVPENSLGTSGRLRGYGVPENSLTSGHFRGYGVTESPLGTSGRFRSPGTSESLLGTSGRFRGASDSTLGASGRYRVSAASESSLGTSGRFRMSGASDSSLGTSGRFRTSDSSLGTSGRFRTSDSSLGTSGRFRASGTPENVLGTSGRFRSLGASEGPTGASGRYRIWGASDSPMGSSGRFRISEVSESPSPMGTSGRFRVSGASDSPMGSSERFRVYGIPESPRAGSSGLLDSPARRGESVRKIRAPDIAESHHDKALLPTNSIDNDKSCVSTNAAEHNKSSLTTNYINNDNASAPSDSSDHGSGRRTIKNKFDLSFLKPGRASHHHVVDTIVESDQTEDRGDEQTKVELEDSGPLSSGEKSTDGSSSSSFGLSSFGEKSSDSTSSSTNSSFRTRTSFLAEKERSTKPRDMQNPRSVSFSAAQTTDYETKSEAILQAAKEAHNRPSVLGSPFLVEQPQNPLTSTVHGDAWGPNRTASATMARYEEKHRHNYSARSPSPLGNGDIDPRQEQERERTFRSPPSTETPSQVSSELENFPTSEPTAPKVDPMETLDQKKSAAIVNSSEIVDSPKAVAKYTRKDQEEVRMAIELELERRRSFNGFANLDPANVSILRFHKGNAKAAARSREDSRRIEPKMNGIDHENPNSLNFHAPSDHVLDTQKPTATTAAAHLQLSAEAEALPKEQLKLMNGGTFSGEQQKLVTGGMFSGEQQKLMNRGTISGEQQKLMNRGTFSGEQQKLMNRGTFSGEQQKLMNGGTFSGEQQKLMNGGMFSGEQQKLLNGGTFSGEQQKLMNGGRFSGEQQKQLYPLTPAQGGQWRSRSARSQSEWLAGDPEKPPVILEDLVNEKPFPLQSKQIPPAAVPHFCRCEAVNHPVSQAGKHDSNSQTGTVSKLPSATDATTPAGSRSTTQFNHNASKNFSSQGLPQEQRQMGNQISGFHANQWPVDSFPGSVHTFPDSANSVHFSRVETPVLNSRRIHGKILPQVEPVNYLRSSSRYFDADVCRVATQNHPGADGQHPVQQRQQQLAVYFSSDSRPVTTSSTLPKGRKGKSSSSGGQTWFFNPFRWKSNPKSKISGDSGSNVKNMSSSTAIVVADLIGVEPPKRIKPPRKKSPWRIFDVITGKSSKRNSSPPITAVAPVSDFRAGQSQRFSSTKLEASSRFEASTRFDSSTNSPRPSVGLDTQTHQQQQQQRRKSTSNLPVASEAGSCAGAFLQGCIPAVQATNGHEWASTAGHRMSVTHSQDGSLYISTPSHRFVPMDSGMEANGRLSCSGEAPLSHRPERLMLLEQELQAGGNAATMSQSPSPSVSSHRNSLQMGSNESSRYSTPAQSRLSKMESANPSTLLRRSVRMEHQCHSVAGAVPNGMNAEDSSGEATPANRSGSDYSSTPSHHLNHAAGFQSGTPLHRKICVDVKGDGTPIHRNAYLLPPVPNAFPATNTKAVQSFHNDIELRRG